MPGDELTCARKAEIDYICVAADLLQRMMSELKCLETNNSRLTLSLAAAGHDLRQRLHGLLRTVDLLTVAEDATVAAELSIKAKALIHRLAGELEQLVFQSGRDQRSSVPPKHCFDISVVLNQLELDWQEEAAAKRLDFEVVPTEAIVESDQSLLAVIMNNIVGNAVRHTTCGGVRLDSTIEDQHLVLAVADSGPGISDAEFHLSYGGSPRSRDLSAGLGQGLSIARRTAEVLGHNLAVVTAPEKGTCVRLYVPLAGQGYDTTTRARAMF
jgi:signal transduction histidine kinase